MFRKGINYWVDFNLVELTILEENPRLQVSKISSLRYSALFQLFFNLLGQNIS